MKKTLMMAFAKGQESKEIVIHRYIGVAPVTIVAINPTKAELEKIYDIQIEKAPEYIGEATVDTNKVPQIRLDFIVKTDADKCNGIDMISKVSFFLAQIPDYNKDQTKVRVINKYGEDAWLPVENARTKTAPDNMSWFAMDGARVAYKGERDLSDFLKNFLVIPNSSYTDKNTGERKSIANLADAEAQLTDIDKYFTGNISEIREIVASQPSNKIKVCFGIKTTNENKQYQDVYTKKTLRLRVTDYSKLDEEIQNSKSNGAYLNTEFSIEPLHEYVVEGTTFTPSVADTAPVDNDTPLKPAWFKR